MRTVVQDYATHRFFEGPVQSAAVTDNYWEKTHENGRYYTDITHTHEKDVAVNINLYNDGASEQFD